ncbi:ADP-ribose pyrophosphatase, mitochondrial-like [Macrosteles quadrilineatus]|uniref:ADP-ribose pyrophosphatase, mitochondrial-like n=1 Tax=Macrosteles quadrilineatus TaxID=74068 RepID=UPI0023E12551|nr:ADP-ribose pyrophosphatase, mitochondrial-like [Macrosteles quadrilineatus]
MHKLIDSTILFVITLLKASKGETSFHDFEVSSERIHFRCRTGIYPFSVERLAVPDDKVRWDCDWSDYKPPFFTAFSTVGQPWADPDIGDNNFNPQWNSVDGLLNRRSYIGTYTVSKNYPINPIGRTGLAGRGVLGRWGPNHASDTVVTRWKRDGENLLIHNPTSGKPILQMIAIQKRSGEWGLPGGMVNPGENVPAAGKREFFEEVLAYEFKSNDSLKIELLDKLFKKGEEIYKGYVDDPRNTDNAWVETIALHYHDASGKLLDSLTLRAGDDACNVSWMDVDRNIQLYSAHQKFVYKMTSRLNAHF